MDYLVFLSGLFLLAAGVGCYFLYREDRRFSRWPMLAIALFCLALKIWWGILVFAAGQDDGVSSARCLLAAAFVTSAVGFCLSPLVNPKNRSSFTFKWAGMVFLLAGTFIAGMSNAHPAFYLTPVVLAAFAAGWKVTQFAREFTGGRSETHPLVSAVLLTIVTAVSMIPQVAEFAYGIKGYEEGSSRLIVLIAVMTATTASIAFCLLVWSRIYQIKRSSLSRTLVRRRQNGTRVILIATLFTATNGAWLAHWLGNQAQQEQTSTLLSALELGADNLDPSAIRSLRAVPTEVATPTYMALRSKLITIRNALPRTRFAYILGIREDRLVFLVDAEDPTLTSTFSPPGQVVEKFPARWQPAQWESESARRPSFDGPYHDRWGTWFTAAVPILDSQHNIIALLGVDYPAREWLTPLAARRLAAMGVTFSVALLLVSLFSFHLISIENTRQVESLSDRLSDAMTAAEFDTWEYFPGKLKINIGERIASTLGWVDRNHPPNLRQILRRIHLADRYQLLNLVRPRESDNDSTYEAEVRIQNSSGRWLWFMLRGRLVRSNQEDTRLVGTVLNIDENHRSRLEIDKQRRFAQHVMESVPNGLAIVNAEGIITYANTAFLRLAHSDTETIIGMNLDQLIEGHDLASIESDGFEATISSADGRKSPVRAFRASLNESGQNVGSILALVDLTATKEAEQNLLRSRAEANRLALVAKRTDNAVVITDAQGRIEWVNEGFTQISGYSREEVLGRTPGSFLQRRASLTDSDHYMRDRIREGMGFETEILNYSKSGRAYLVHIECQPLFDTDGTLNGFMAIERDITRTRRSANLLEAVASISTTLLAKRIEPKVWGEILQALGTAANVERCYLFQVQTHPTLGTPSFTQKAEWNSSRSEPQIDNPELQNLPVNESGFGRWHEQLMAGNEIMGPIREFPDSERPLLESQQIQSIIIVPIFAADQLWGFMGFDACIEERIWENWEVSILRSAAANIGIRQVAQNESDALVLARDEARNAAIAAEKANQAKSTFLATMSHEIRTPLNAVLGMASLLETTPLNSQQQDYAATILNSGNFLLELINDILDYSRIENGKIELDHSPFTLAQICRDAFDVVRPSLRSKDIELICRIEPHIPARFKGDRARIRQILVNLLSNAVKFTKSGEVTLVIEGSANSHGRWKISMEVTDTGIGIAEDAISRLFRPFVQEDSSTTRRFGGSGLGLAISKRLAELMGGNITVRSSQGLGSCFTATLDILALGSPSPSYLPSPPASPSMTALVVDDNPLNLKILQESLASWGIDCHTAPSALHAIQLWRQNGAYPLVITDHLMAEMDGIDLTRYLRNLPEAANTRFNLLSADSHFPSEIIAIFHEVTLKPLWASTLQATLYRQFPTLIPQPGAIKQPAVEMDAVSLGNLRVLVAEDNPNNQKVIRLLLRRLGIEPDIVGDGEQAVSATLSKSYQIILMDIQMPLMDGLEATRRIRSLGSSPRPHIVALTANAFQEDRDAAAAAGMDDYLPKPITLARLRDKFSSIIQSPSAAETT